MLELINFETYASLLVTHFVLLPGHPSHLFALHVPDPLPIVRAGCLQAVSLLLMLLSAVGICIVVDTDVEDSGA